MALRGNAGFRYLPVSIEEPTEQTLAMNAPLQDVRAIVRTQAYVFDPESNEPEFRETVVTALPVREIQGRIPMHPDSEELLEMLAEMVMGAVAAYYPDLSGGESYPSVLAEPDLVQEILQARPRPYGEWDGTVRLRHAEGGTYEGILQRRAS